MMTPHNPSPDQNQFTNRPEDRAAEARERLDSVRASHGAMGGVAISIILVALAVLIIVLLT